MAKQYVSDMISDEYKNWQEGDRVIIATPTGSGKTTFVVSKLLKEAMSCGQHVVYYCNRKVLHDQFEVQSISLIERVFGKDLELADNAVNYLHIFTYQGAENVGNYPGVQYTLELIPSRLITMDKDPSGLRVAIRQPDRYTRKEVHADEIMYYIFDEAHYFVSDALINNQTNYWYNQNLHHGISVFLTATPKPLLAFLSRPPLNDDFIHVIHSFSNRTKIENKYTKIESSVIGLLNSWKRYDKVEFDFEKPRGLKEAFMRRWRNPLTRYFSYFGNLYDTAYEQPYYYRTEPDYSYIDAKYFYDDDDLLEQIRRTGDEKWIIFVDSEANGLGLLRAIEEHGSGNAVLLSSRRIKSDPNAMFVYNEVVQTQKFPCRILISTSVLDCGINIVDNSVKHMAITCDNETTFLQMLGRKRIDDGEQLHLYIGLYPYRKIQTRYNQCLDKLLFMIRLGLKNQLNNSFDQSYLLERQLNELVTEISAGHRNNLSWTEGPLKHVKPNGHIRVMPEKTTNVAQYMSGFAYSKTAMLQMVSRLYDYRLAMDRYRREVGLGIELADFIFNFYMASAESNMTLEAFVFDYQFNRHRILPRNEFNVWWEKIKAMEPKDDILSFDLKVERDDFFYLKHQLSWIGKEYDPSCWLLSSEKRLKLMAFLENAVGSALCQDEHHNEQRDFSLQCIKLMLDLPLPPKNLRRNKSRYGPENWPGRNALNKWMSELKLPYCVGRDQRNKVDGKYKTRWIIKHIETEETQPE